MKLTLRGASDEDSRRLLAAWPGVEFTTDDTQTSSWILEKVEGLWELRHEGLRLRIDFDATGPDYRRKALRGGAEILARALGGVATHGRVLDLSAGLGQDAVFMSQMGFSVTALERSPLLAFLLAEAKAKTQRSELQSLRFISADAKDWLTKESRTDFDVVYFDPMYPEKKKSSALPRQEMRIFRELVGDDVDAADVLQAARQGPWRRVVVKRPLKAEPLAPDVRHRFEGHSVRYDIYVRA